MHGRSKRSEPARKITNSHPQASDPKSAILGHWLGSLRRQAPKAQSALRPRPARAASRSNSTGA
eukprot:13054499-Alexandrium_andersonii.AAC.1